MELVEGPTLADRIAQGAIPVGEALAIAQQIAQALEAAHELGVIHRDWSRTGNELFYIGSTATGQLAVVPVIAKAGFSFGTPTRFPFRLMAGRLSPDTRAFDALPDGRFVGLVADDADYLAGIGNTEMRIILNWFEELKRLVPVS